jgi:group I intron endonuclease
MKGIYCIECISNGRKYYGSSMNIEKRLLQHKHDLKKQRHHNLQLQRAVNKYSILDFQFYLVEETYDHNRELLLLLEQKYIDNNYDGYNMAPANGGDILSKHPNKNSIRERIKVTHGQTLNKMTTIERKLKFGKTGSNNSNWKEGGTSYKLCPKCNKNKIQIKSKNCANCRDRTKENNPFFNRTHTEETKLHLREKNSGNNSWIKNIDPSILPFTKNYIIIYPSGEIKKVSGLKAIAKEFNVSVENVHATLKRISNGKIPKRGVFANVIIKAEMAV